MRIQAINTIRNNYFKQNRPVSFKQEQDAFIKNSQPKTFEQFAQSKRKFDISDYKSLSEKEIKIAKEKATDLTKNAAKDSIVIANILKKNLDKTYGENNYILACIGTSPSGLGRVLEFSGVETKYIPLSNFKGDERSIFKRLTQNKKGEEKYISFLKEQNVIPTNEENEKTILFIDYTHTGESLENFEAFIKKRCNIQHNRIKFLDLEKTLHQTSKDSIFEEESNIFDYIFKYCICCMIEDLTGVPHLDISDFKNIDKKLKEETNIQAKLFNLIIIDELNKQGKLKENPLNKNSL